MKIRTPSNTGVSTSAPVTDDLRTSKNLPVEIWVKILYLAIVGQGSPDIDTLDNCRKVCKEWNEIIKRSVWLRPNKKWGIITKSMIEQKWVPENFPRSKKILYDNEGERIR